MITSEITPSNSQISRDASVSLESSQAKREEAKKKALEKKKRQKFIRNRLGAAAAVLAIGIPGGAAAINALRSDDRTGIDHKVTVQFGDTLSEIAEEELIRGGDPDPTTQEINEEVNVLKDSSPDLNDGAAGVGDIINVPK